jgi:hypothetical protein
VAKLQAVPQPQTILTRKGNNHSPGRMSNLMLKPKKSYPMNLPLRTEPKCLSQLGNPGKSANLPKRKKWNRKNLEVPSRLKQKMVRTSKKKGQRDNRLGKIKGGNRFSPS